MQENTPLKQTLRVCRGD